MSWEFVTGRSLCCTPYLESIILISDRQSDLLTSKNCWFHIGPRFRSWPSSKCRLNFKCEVFSTQPDGRLDVRSAANQLQEYCNKAKYRENIYINIYIKTSVYTSFKTPTYNQLTVSLTTLLYGCETWSFAEKELHKASVAWNNSFRRMFSCCWR